MENKEEKKEEKKTKKLGRPATGWKHKSFKQLYNENPEYKAKHLNKMNEQFQCEICGTHYTRVNKMRHFKTKYHISYLNDPEVLAKY